MPLQRESRQRINKSLKSASARDIALAVLLTVAFPAHTPALIPKSAAAAAEPAAPADPLGRATPRSAMLGLLKYEDRHDFATAARYLQPSPGQKANLPQRAEELLALHPRFKGNIALLSDDPNGTVEEGLPPGEVRAVC